MGGLGRPTPLEQQLNGVENSLYMKSTNANDGSMVLEIAFEVGTDQDMNNVLTQNRVSAATAKLPEEVKRFKAAVKKSRDELRAIIENTPEDFVQYVKMDQMGTIREDLVYDIARHVDEWIAKNQSTWDGWLAEARKAAK